MRSAETHCLGVSNANFPEAYCVGHSGGAGVCRLHYQPTAHPNAHHRGQTLAYGNTPDSGHTSGWANGDAYGRAQAFPHAGATDPAQTWRHPLHPHA